MTPSPSSLSKTQVPLMTVIIFQFIHQSRKSQGEGKRSKAKQSNTKQKGKRVFLLLFSTKRNKTKLKTHQKHYNHVIKQHVKKFRPNCL